MIDRYAIYSDLNAVGDRFEMRVEDEFTIPNYNASPAQELPVITKRGQKELNFYNWAVVKQWSNNNSISNKLLSVASSDLVNKRPLKKALLNRRCIVPVDGFYLWKHYSKKRKTAHYFKQPDEAIFGLPAIWEEYEDMDGKMNFTFRFIENQTPPSKQEYGNLVPCILEKDDEEKWLDAYSTEDELIEIMEKNHVIQQLMEHSVSSEILDIAKNKAHFIEQHSQVDQLGNYTLFD